MKTLVTVSSKHGATDEIGQAIADALHAAGLDVDFIAPERVESLDPYDTVVVGSALYLGRWMAPARDFVTAHADELRRRQVWLFASGPVTPTRDSADAAEGEKLQALVDARDARVFAGRLEQAGLSLAERTIARLIKSPWGDYRPWDAIHEWADSIAASVGSPREAVTAG